MGSGNTAGLERKQRGKGPGAGGKKPGQERRAEVSPLPGLLERDSRPCGLEALPAFWRCPDSIQRSRTQGNAKRFRPASLGGVGGSEPEEAGKAKRCTSRLASAPVAAAALIRRDARGCASMRKLRAEEGWALKLKNPSEVNNHLPRFPHALASVP